MSYRSEIKATEAEYSRIYEAKAKPLEKRYEELIPEKLQGKLELLASLDRLYDEKMLINSRLLEESEIFVVKASLVKMYDFIHVPYMINEEALEQTLYWEEMRLVREHLIPFMKEVANEASKINDELLKLEMESSRLSDMEEGETHVNWLLNEFGEDVFSDR